LTITQPAHGYRAGVDPVMLAAAVPARAGDSVLDLGCGVGVAALCLQQRLSGALSLAGLERHADTAELARGNAATNGLAMEVVTGDLADMPAALRERSFDHVLTNPPYFDRGRGSQSVEESKEAAMGEGTSLAIWIDAAIRRLKPKGTLTVIHSAERLPDLLAACDSRLGCLRVLPIAAREGRPADRIILHARKGSRAAFQLLAPLVLHRGTRHLRDGNDYFPGIEAVLRDCAPLPVDFA